MDDLEQLETLASSPGEEVEAPATPAVVRKGTDSKDGQTDKTAHGIDTLQGTFIGNYRVVKPLGEGAMGKVLLAEHPRIGRQVAIKVLKAELSANPNVSERFVQEARAVNAIAHRNIIEIFDFGNLPDGRLYYVMAYIAGEELGARITRQRQFEPAEVAPLLDQIAAALDAAHAAGVVHRDLKPDNIYIAQTPDGDVVKVLDFGIAKLLEKPDGSQGQGQTATGMIMGTPMYMAPEQAAGDISAISGASDIYSLGVILFQMLTGTPPYMARTTAELLRAHIVTPPPPLSRLRPDLPEAITFCVDQCLAKAPDERPATATVVHKIFKAGLEQNITIEQAATAMGTIPPVAEPVEAEADAADTDAADTEVDDPPMAGTAYEPSKGTMAAFTQPTRRYIAAGVAMAAAIAVAVWLVLELVQSDPANNDVAKKTPDAGASMTSGRTAHPGTAPGSSLPPTPGAPRENTATITFRGGAAIQAELTIGDSAPIRRALPLTLPVVVGQRLTARFTRAGHRSQTDSWLITGPRTLDIALTPGTDPPQPMTTMVATPTMRVARSMRVRPAITRPMVLRPTMKPPIMKKHTMALGPGTIKPMF